MDKLYFIKDIKKSNKTCKTYSGEKSYIDTGNVQNTKIIATEEYEYSNKPSRANVCVQKGDVLFAKMQDSIKVLQIDDSNNDFIYSTGFYCFNDNRIKPEYLKYFLISPNFNIQKDSKCTGSTQKAINDENLQQIFVPVPSLSKQEKIVEELDLISSAISENEKRLELYDEMISAKFNEMFKDETTKIKVADCCELYARIGWQALTQKEHMQTGDYMLITGTDFKDGLINYNTCVYVKKERYEMDKKIIVKNGDILITKDGTIGKVAIVKDLPKPATLNSGIFVLRPDTRFKKSYIQYVFKSPLFKQFIDSVSSGATIKHLNQNKLINFEIPLPELTRQEEFSKILSDLNSLKETTKIKIKNYQELLNSKMNEYFNE